MNEKTLTMLEGRDWGPPTHSSSLVRRCHELRHVPIGSLDAEGLRMLIGQNIGLSWLMPLAVAMLEDEPFVSGDFYEGDLLAAVLRADPSWYAQTPDIAARVRAIAEDVRGRLGERSTGERRELGKVLEGWGR